MNIHIHVERLILDGLPVTNLQGPQVRAAVEKELARLLAAEGLSHEIRGAGVVPHVSGGTLRIGTEIQAARLGQSIAQAVHEGIGIRKSENAK